MLAPIPGVRTLARRRPLARSGRSARRAGRSRSARPGLQLSPSSIPGRLAKASACNTYWPLWPAAPNSPFLVLCTDPPACLTVPRDRPVVSAGPCNQGLLFGLRCHTSRTGVSRAPAQLGHLRRPVRMLGVRPTSCPCPPAGRRLRRPMGLAGHCNPRRINQWAAASRGGVLDACRTTPTGGEAPTASVTALCR